MKKIYDVIKLSVITIIMGGFMAMIPLTISTAAQDQLYVVEGQLVDVTAENPVQAREKAILEAQRLAFDVLSTRILSEDEYTARPNFNDDVLSTLVKDFSVKDERTSSDRYKATFTLRFDEDKVERILGLTGVSYAQEQRSPILVLPFLQVGSRLMIWEEPNPWRDIWQSAVLDDGLVPIRVPLGDIVDMADVPDASIFSGQSGNLTSIASRYGADTVFLVVAKSRGAALDASDGVLLTLYKASGQGVDRVNELMVPAGIGATFSSAMNDVVAYLRNDWKQQTTVVDMQASDQLKVQAGFNGLAQWVDIKQRLESIDFISSINSDTMTHNRADLTIDYTGSLDGLRLVLGQNDLLISETPLGDGRYVLKLNKNPYNY